jgi:hypothetical protein
MSRAALRQQAEHLLAHAEALLATATPPEPGDTHEVLERLLPILEARRERVLRGEEVLPPPTAEMIAQQEYCAAVIRELLERQQSMPRGTENQAPRLGG